MKKRDTSVVYKDSSSTENYAAQSCTSDPRMLEVNVESDVESGMSFHLQRTLNYAVLRIKVK